MRFLADENFSKPILRLIARSGHSVRTIQQKSLQGSADETVADIALAEKRIILTFDKDFLINQPKNLQVIVFEFPRTATSEIILLIDGFLEDTKILTKTKHKIFKFNKFGLTKI